MNKAEKKFYEVFTDLQCFILANMNRSDINGVTATHYNIIEYIYRNDKCIVKEIAKAFNISPPAISKQLKLSVADKGKFIIDNSENFRETVAKKASKTLTKDDLKNLTELLNKVLAEIMK